MSGRRALALVLASVIALAIALVFPRHLWVAQRQVDGLFEPKVSNVHLIRKGTTLVAGQVEVNSQTRQTESSSVAMELNREPLFRFLRWYVEPTARTKDYEFDRLNETGFWSVAARKASIWHLPTAPNRHEYPSSIIISNLRRPRDTQLRLWFTLLHELNRRRTGRFNGSPAAESASDRRMRNALRIAAMNVEKGGDYAVYDNGWQLERDAILRVLDRLEPYSGQDRFAEVDRSMEFNDAAALKQLPNQLLPYCDLQMRKDLAQISANLIRQGEPALLMVVGRSMLADTIKPVGASFKEPQDHGKLIQWATQRDAEFGTGTFFADLVSRSDLVAEVSAPSRRPSAPASPLRMGSLLVFGGACLLTGFLSLLMFSSFAQSDTIRKMRSHLFAALGWLVAVAMMPEVGSDLFALVAASHIGLAFAVLGNRPARFGTSLLALASLLPLLSEAEPETWNSYAMIAGFFWFIAISTWLLSQDRRWRLGFLAGWAVTLVCFGLAGIGLATLLPAFGWVLGLLFEKKTGPARQAEIVYALILFAAAGATLFHVFPGAVSTAAAFSMSFVGASAVYRTNRGTVLRGGAVCLAIFSALYVAATAWSLRFDRQNGAAIEAYLIEADRIRSQSGW